MLTLQLIGNTVVGGRTAASGRRTRVGEDLRRIGEAVLRPRRIGVGGTSVVSCTVHRPALSLASRWGHMVQSRSQRVGLALLPRSSSSRLDSSLRVSLLGTLRRSHVAASLRGRSLRRLALALALDRAAHYTADRSSTCALSRRAHFADRRSARVERFAARRIYRPDRSEDPARGDRPLYQKFRRA